MGFTQALSNEILDHVLGRVAMALNVDPIYLGLSTSTPTNTGGNVTEPSGNNYSRVSVTNNATEFPNASAGAKANANLIPFATASGSWGTVTHWVLFNAASSGTVLMSGALSASKTPGSGDTLKFQTGALTVTLA